MSNYKKFMADEEKSADDVEFDDDGNEIKLDDKGENADGDNAEKKDPEDTDTDDDTEDKPDDTGDDDEEVVPLTRGSVAQHIIARKNKTIEKLRSKKADEEDEEDDPDDADKEPDKASVEKIVDDRLKPITDAVGKNLDEGELKQLFADEPEAKKYDKRIRIYMAHPQYQGVSPEVIFHHLAFKNAQALGAKKKKIADTEADLNKSGGRNLKPNKAGVKGAPTIEEMDNMSDADLEKLTNDALQGKFVE